MCYQSSPKESPLVIIFIVRSYNLGLWCTKNTTRDFLFYTTLEEVDFTLEVAWLLG